MNNTKCINSLKGVGAFIIAFVGHYVHFSPEEFPLKGIFYISSDWGGLMVDVFFMLSGFGMMIGYADKVLNHEITFTYYIWKRIKKLYPLFFITLILISVLQFIYKNKMGETFVYPNYDFFHFFLNVLLLQNGIWGTDASFNGPSWCISISMILYVIFYLIAFHSLNKKIIVYKFGGIGVIGAFILAWWINIPLLNLQVAKGLLGFSIGVVLAYVYEKRNKVNCKFIGYCSLLALVYIYIYARFINFGALGVVEKLFILAIAPMIILSSLFVRWLNSFWNLKLFQYLGSISIEIYLFHFIVQCLIKNVEIYGGVNIDYSSCLAWCIYVIVTLIISIIYKEVFRDGCARLFEKLLLKKEREL